MAGKEREAGVRLTLKKDGFKSGIKDAENDVKSSATGMQRALKAGLSEGIKGGKEALSSFLSTVKSGPSAPAGLGGVRGGAEMIRGALDTEAAFKKISSQIKYGTGEVVNFRSMMDLAKGSATKWGKDINELSAAMSGIYSETGDKDFMAGAVDIIATTSRGAKEEIGTLGEISGTLNEKFGITTDELGDTLAAVISLGNRGGVSVQELSGSLSGIGAIAKEAGLQGKDGFEKMVGLMNIADDGGKNVRKNMSMLSGLLETLGSKADRTKAFMKLGIDPSAAKGDVTDMIGQILKKTGGNKDKLSVAFGGTQLAFLVSLGEKYASAFSQTEGNVKSKTDAALAAYQNAIAEASQSHLTYANIQDDAAKAMEGGKARMEAAMEKMKAAFMRPEITDAIGKLAEALPMLADVVASVVGFVAEHPILGAAGVAGGVAAKGALEAGLSAALKAAFDKGGKGAADVIGGALKSAAPGVAQTIAGAGMGLGGTFALALGGAAVVAALSYTLTTAILNAKAEADAKKYEEAGKTTLADAKRKMTESGASGGDATDVGDDFTTLSDERGDDGKFKELHGDAAVRYLEDRQQKLDDWSATKAEEESNAAKQSFISADNLTPMEAAASARRAAGMKEPPRGGGGANSGIDAKLFAEMMGAKELKVRIVNPEAIRGGGDGAAPSPGPGYAPRE